MFTFGCQRCVPANKWVTVLTSTHLLCDHDNERSQSGAADSRNREELHTALEVVRFADNLCLDLKLRMDVVEIASCLDWAKAKAQQRLPGLTIAVLLDQPSG